MQLIRPISPDQIEQLRALVNSMYQANGLQVPCMERPADKRRQMLVFWFTYFGVGGSMPVDYYIMERMRCVNRQNQYLKNIKTWLDEQANESE